MPATRRRILHVTALGTLALAGCSGSTDGTGGGGGSVQETSSVSMSATQFEPRNIQVETGTTVTWTNDNSADHTVTSASDNWSFDATIANGESTEFTFDSSGVYGVYCRFHGSEDLTGMSMKVGVGDATIENPLGGGDDDGGDDSEGGAY